ncbi:GFA family protein [Aliiroseovarius sp.]|uniref:GFA family protein n=1 Tax=Aliiroseovarius sp. TaxID=1872442 RepID=UPI003BAAEB5E
MCGAVTINATLTEDRLRACHCDMCRAWTSGAFVSVASEPGSVTAEGPIKVIQTSDWAQRAICAECGSPLWYEITAEGPGHGQKNLSAGLFPDAAGMDLKLEFYSDKKPGGYAFDGDHRKMTEAEMLAIFAPKDGDTT